MIFSSLIFLFAFFPLFLSIYYLVPFRFKNTILLNYICGLLIDFKKEHLLF